MNGLRRSACLRTNVDRLRTSAERAFAESSRTSADIRQEIAELDEEGFREDEARNAQAAKIQARIRGRKARREAAPKRAALQRARADARALADKVAALEAENARLRQAASPPSGAKTPENADDWEQCVDEATGHTYYYSSSFDLCKNQIIAARLLHAIDATAHPTV